MSRSLSFVLNIDFPGNSCLDKKGKEKSRLTPKKERITILFGQKVGFLRRKCAFSPKKSNISSEEKSTCERTFRPISLYVSADTTVCVHEQGPSSRIFRPFPLILGTIFRLSRKCYIERFFLIIMVYCPYRWNILIIWICITLSWHHFVFS